MIERSNKGLHNFLYDYLQKESLTAANNLLDIASGSGAWLNRFTSIKDSTKLGLDLDINQFSLSSVKALPFNFNNYNNEIFGSFSLITCIELIEHLENPGKIFQLIKNNLATDGVCLMSTPNIHSIHARLRYLIKGRLGHFDDKSDSTHIYPVYIENMQRLTTNHELLITDIFTYPNTNNYTFPVRFLATLLVPFIPSNYSGDNIVFLLKHKS
jgi:2-polyprenyl-3-methyl-5-hydroxy-6-metoxy-1,4-benzoquinol methylase